MFNIVLLGPPGAGKGVQSQLLAKKHNLKIIGPGNLFRAAVKAKTPLGLEIKDCIESGNLVPDKVVLDLVGKKIKEAYAKDPKLAGFLFDGFPRSKEQALGLEDLLASINTKIEIVIVLVVHPNNVQKRLAKRYEIEKRPDDRERPVIDRIVAYNEYSQKVMHCYDFRYPIKYVEGQGRIEEVEKRIDATLDHHDRDKRWDKFFSSLK